MNGKTISWNGGLLRVAGLLGSFLALSATAVTAAASETLTARGNEPGWHVQVSEERLTLSTQDGQTVEIAPAPEVAVADGASTYAAQVDGKPFRLVVTEGLCVDTMSGMPYPMTAALTWDGGEFAGCAGEPATLLHGEWIVEEIAGNAPVVGSQPALAFDPEGRLSGNGSCNRLIGSFALSGEGLSFSELGTTMMACEQPLMDQEFAFVQMLEAVDRFDIDADRRLVLHGNDGRTVVARRQ